VTIKVSFDELLQEAQREPVEIAMPDGDPILVRFPDGDGVKVLKAAVATGDEDRMLLALFGEENGTRLLKKFAAAPGDLPGRLVKRVMVEFGMPKDFFASPA
jgi:hypothetical protein